MGYVALATQVIGKIVQHRNQRKQIKAQGEAIRQEAENAIHMMNREVMNFEIARNDAFDMTVNELSKLDINALGLVSAVKSAVSEEYAGGGNTAKLVNRSASADVLRSRSQLKENYLRKSNEIDLNIETSYLNAKRAIAGLKMPKMPSKSAFFLDLASTIFQGVTAVEGERADAIANGMDYNHWTGKTQSLDRRSGTVFDIVDIYKRYKTQPTENITYGLKPSYFKNYTDLTSNIRYGIDPSNVYTSQLLRKW